VVVCSGWGRSSQWYQNLAAHPNTTIQLGSRVHEVSAVFLNTSECGDEMVRYSLNHPRAARRLSKFMNFDCDGTTAGYRAVGEQLPIVHLDRQL
ncbi:MAG: nitroreductase family deazaflavin-dependent oxidoreductase, partial [Actinobacteria bacterium]|nr:nitroreductase family deazaflavin-dependent oxidoreductase [Actinomycetota bacterium]